MIYLKTYENFNDALKSVEEQHDIRSNISDIFYELEDIGFNINVSSTSHNINEWSHQIRIKKQNDSLFSFEEVQEIIERFLDYVEPYVGVISSFPGRKPIDFQIDHKFSLTPKLKYNLSYDEMKKVMDKDDKASSHWSDTGHVIPKLGDNLRTIYIEARVNLKTNESKDWDSRFTCPIFDLPKEMRDEVSDVLLELEDEGYQVTFDPFVHSYQHDQSPYIYVMAPIDYIVNNHISFDNDGKSNFTDNIKDVINRIDVITRDYGWRIDVHSSNFSCAITFIK